MRKGFLTSVLTLLACAGSGFAQEGLPSPIPSATWSDVPPVTACCPPSGAVSNGSHAWIAFDYLNWWISPMQINAPLVTTGNPLSPTGGALTDPATRVLFGNSDVDFGPQVGGRLSMGYWFGCDAKWGIEGSGFLLATQRNSFIASSNNVGSPLLALPFQTPAGVEARDLISSPAVPQTGTVFSVATTRLWGADVNAACNVYRDCTCAIDLLAGFRYYDLNETLTLNPSSSAAPTPIRIPAGDFHLLVMSTSLSSAYDYFSTHNQFYGGQVGGRAAYHGCGPWSAEILGMVALGDTEHTLYASGNSFSTNTVTVLRIVNGTGKVVNSASQTKSTSAKNGFFTNPNNIGKFESSSFSVVPQIELKVGYDITPHIRATIGFDALYWTDVERPGNQINHVIGLGPVNNLTNLWAEGFNTGLEIRW
jgi:Putative beta barrel porin-7 (BBP7)